MIRLTQRLTRHHRSLTFLLSSRFLLFVGICLALQVHNKAQAADPAARPYSEWALATPDLDGDAQPDSAHGTSLGYDRKGYAYSLRFQLSDQDQESTIQVHARDPWSIHVAFRDVDGDHDLDLVITGGLHHEPLGVWLNTNGTFHLAETKPAAAKGLLEESSLERQAPLQLARIWALPGRTMPLCAALTTLWPVAWPRGASVRSTALDAHLVAASTSSSPRAPPVLLFAPAQA